MATNRKRYDEVLATLTPKMQRLCADYQRAKDAEDVATRAYREALKVRRQAQHATWCTADMIGTPFPDIPDKSIVYNLRNGRLYEKVTPPAGREWAKLFRHLHPKTGRICGQYTTYAYGPKLVLPKSHPFVQKRINARLAERLEGKE